MKVAQRRKPARVRRIEPETGDELVVELDGAGRSARPAERAASAGVGPDGDGTVGERRQNLIVRSASGTAPLRRQSDTQVIKAPILSEFGSRTKRTVCRPGARATPAKA